MTGLIKSLFFIWKGAMSSEKIKLSEKSVRCGWVISVYLSPSDIEVWYQLLDKNEDSMGVF